MRVSWNGSKIKKICCRVNKQTKIPFWVLKLFFSSWISSERDVCFLLLLFERQSPKSSSFLILIKENSLKFHQLTWSTQMNEIYSIFLHFELNTDSYWYRIPAEVSFEIWFCFILKYYLFWFFVASIYFS